MTAGLIVAGAVVQGTDHLADATCCQDAFKSTPVLPGPGVVLAVADGAGSRHRSALGAHLAVDIACRLLAVDVPQAGSDGAEWTAWISSRAGEVVEGWQQAARAVLVASADVGRGGGVQVRTSELAAALCAAVVRPPWAAFVCVGDCFGVVFTRAAPSGDVAERVHLVLPPPVAGSSPPLFLSSPTARARARSFALWDPELTGVALATDGCVPLALDHPTAHGLPPAAGPRPVEGFFLGLADTLRSNGGDAEPLRALLSGPEAGYSGDDLTVLCALAPAWGG